MQESILILDFGGQYSQLIARRIREDHVYCDILPYDTEPEHIRRAGYKGLVLTGGPNHVNGDDAPHCDPSIFELAIPVLGICYGAQLMAMMLGGQVGMPEQREYGRVPLEVTDKSILFSDVPENTTCWMSHADRIEQMPPGFQTTARTKTCPIAAMEYQKKALYAVQFHPEVQHTPEGSRMLHHFLYDICGCTGQWRMTTFAKEAIQKLREQIGTGKVLCGISGGVDSSVAALLVHRAVGQQLTGVFVDHGFLRAGEADAVERVLKKQFDMNLVRVDASERFLEAISGVTDSEEKRKRIGTCFIRVFEEEAKRIGDVDFLVQGTIYPDVIESGTGQSAVIKSHHNVGGLPSEVGFRSILEPLRDLFKDEVRQVGQALGLPESLVLRQPFPGPGLAIRVMGAVTAEKLLALRKADAIFTDEIMKAGLDHTVHQYFAVLTGVRSVGVMGDERTYDQVVALRGVTTTDFMTADWARLPYDVLAKVSERIVNEVLSINRVVYDITSKPPATIEWE